MDMKPCMLPNMAKQKSFGLLECLDSGSSEKIDHLLYLTAWRAKGWK